MAPISEISSTKSEAVGTVKTYATLRVSGDRLAPERITRILKVVPTGAYRKGGTYAAGPRNANLIGRTGLWYFSTDGFVASDNLEDHLYYLLGLLIPGRTDAAPLTALRKLIEREALRGDVTCFWHGRHGAKPPAVPRNVAATLRLLPAEVETDFDTDETEPAEAASA